MTRIDWLSRVAMGVILLLVPGCPLRSEKITIGRDGAVSIQLQYAGSAAELARFDALPSEKAGWRVERSVKQEGKDTEPTHELQAERKFAPGEALPRNFIVPGETDADSVLDFPTTLRIEGRPDGRYYYFSRTYSPRPWAYAHYWEEHFIDDEVKRVSAKPVEQLSADERLQVIQALVAVEAHRHLELAKVAMANGLAQLAVEHALRARHAMLEVYERAGERLPEVIAQCEKAAGQQDDCYQAASAKLTSQAEAALIESLRMEANLTVAEVASFNAALRRAKRYFEITNDLGGHAFEIQVTMPGEIVAHNAEKVESDGDASEGSVTWQFDGRAFRDRAHELIVVSRVPHSNSR